MKKVIEIEVSEGEPVVVLRGTDIGFHWAMLSLSNDLSEQANFFFDRDQPDLGLKLKLQAQHLRKQGDIAVERYFGDRAPAGVPLRALGACPDFDARVNGGAVALEKADAK